MGEGGGGREKNPKRRQQGATYKKDFGGKSLNAELGTCVKVVVDVLGSRPYGFCGRKATLQHQHLSTYVSFEFTVARDSHSSLARTAGHPSSLSESVAGIPWNARHSHSRFMPCPDTPSATVSLMLIQSAATSPVALTPGDSHFRHAVWRERRRS